MRLRLFGCLLLGLIGTNFGIARTRCATNKPQLAQAYQYVSQMIAAQPTTQSHGFDHALQTKALYQFQSQIVKGPQSFKPLSRPKVSYFALTSKEISADHFPKKPDDITPKEWRMLSQFFSMAALPDAEIEGYHYFLADLNGDGLRDLLIQYYSGGTSLFTDINLYWQVRGKGFKLDQTKEDDVWRGISGRPAVQNLYIVDILGKLYAADVEFFYDKDVLTLSPLSVARSSATQASSAALTPQLVIYYRVQHALLDQPGFFAQAHHQTSVWVRNHQTAIAHLNAQLNGQKRGHVNGQEASDSSCMNAVQLSQHHLQLDSDKVGSDKADNNKAQFFEQFSSALHYTMNREQAFLTNLGDKEGQCYYAELVCMLGGAESCALNLIDMQHDNARDDPFQSIAVAVTSKKRIKVALESRKMQPQD